MNNKDTTEEAKQKSISQTGDHYICLGGCHGVSKVPGICQSAGCAHLGHKLVKCNCTDGLHNNFMPVDK